MAKHIRRDLSTPVPMVRLIFWQNLISLILLLLKNYSLILSLLAIISLHAFYQFEF